MPPGLLTQGGDQKKVVGFWPKLSRGSSFALGIEGANSATAWPLLSLKTFLLTQMPARISWREMPWPFAACGAPP